MELTIGTQVELRDKKDFLKLIATGEIIENNYDFISRKTIATIKCNNNEIRYASYSKDFNNAIWTGTIEQSDVDKMFCIASLQWHRRITSLKTLASKIDGLQENEIRNLCQNQRYLDVIYLTVMQSYERTRRGFIKNIEAKNFTIDEQNLLVAKRFRIDSENAYVVYNFIENSYYY